jgi:hypothetical protein
MLSWNPASGPYRPRRPAGGLLPALAALFWLPSAAAAEGIGAWQLASDLDLRLATYYRYDHGKGTTYPALGTHLNVELSSPIRPYAAGVFADYELATNPEHSDLQLAGAWARYRVGRWELSAVAAHFASRDIGGLWVYSGKLQFKPRPGHKFAVEAIGAMRGGEPALQLVYETDLARHLTLSLNVGVGPNRLQDVGAITKFTWNLR